MSESSGEVSISPLEGTRRFRRNARIAFRDGSLTVTDRRGRSSSVPVDGAPGSAKYLLVILPSDPKGRLELAIEDGLGQSFAITDASRWDNFDVDDLGVAAGLERQKVGVYQDTPGPLRPDGRLLRDSTWWRYGPATGTVGFAAAVTSNGGLLPRWIGFPVALACFVFLMAGLFSGAYTGHRVGRDMLAEQARLAAEPASKDPQKRKGSPS